MPKSLSVTERRKIEDEKKKRDTEEKETERQDDKEKSEHGKIDKNLIDIDDKMKEKVNMITDHTNVKSGSNDVMKEIVNESINKDVNYNRNSHKNESEHAEVPKELSKIRELVPTDIGVTVNAIEEVILESGSVNSAIGRVDFTVRHQKLKYFEEQVKLFPFDTQQLEIVPCFVGVSNCDPYIGYRNSKPIVQQINQHIYLTEAEKLVVSESLDIFKANVSDVFFGLSDMFKGTRYTDMILVSTEGIQPLGYKGDAAPNNIIEVFNGCMKIIATVMNDRRVCYNFRCQTMNYKTAVPDGIIQANIPNDPGVSPVLAAYYNLVPWMKNEINNALSSGISQYKLGRLRVIPSYNISLIESYEYALNIDQYSAAILNVNFNTIMGNVDGLDRYRRMLEAYSPPYTIILLNTLQSLVLTYHPPADYMLSVLMAGCSLIPEVQSLIVQRNIYYLERANILQYESANRIFYPDQSASTGSGLFTAIASRQRSANFSDITAMLGLEAAPKFTILQLRDIDVSNDTEMSLVVLVEMLLLQILTPSIFYYVRGHAQNIILRCFNNLVPIEKFQFVNKFGYRAKRNSDGTFSYDIQNKQEWKSTSELLGSFIPSLFTNPDFNSAGCPLLGRYIRLFVPIGELRTDTSAINAEFPRLAKEPQHYIPYLFNETATDTSFSVKISELVTVLQAITSDMRKRMDQSRIAYDSIAKWFNHLRVRCSQFDSTLCFHWAALFRILANSLLNFSCQYKGVNDIQSLQDYGIISDTNVTITSLYKTRDRLASNVYNISSGFVLQLIGHGITPIMNRSGYNNANVKISDEMDEIIFPDAGIGLSEDLKVWAHIKQLVTPFGFIVNLFSPKMSDYSFVKQAITNMIPIAKTMTSFRQMVDAVGEFLGTKSEALGREFLNNDDLSSRIVKYINPVLRRLNLGTVIDYDESIDVSIMSGYLQLLSADELERFAIGMDMVYQTPLCKLKRGIRIGYAVVGVRNPNFCMPVPDDFLRIDYEDIRFLPTVVGFSTTAGLIVNGQTYSTIDEWPKLHVIINQRLKTNSIYCKLLSDGIKNKKVIIDIIDQYFVPRIVDNVVTTYEEAIALLTDREQKIRVIDFTDAVLAKDPVPGSYNLRNLYFEQFIFPLTSIMDHVSCSGLTWETSDKPAQAKSVNPLEYDTGKSVNGIPHFSNGSNKLRSAIISTSNIVHTVSANLTYPEDIPYEIIKRKAFFPDMGGN